MHIAPSAWLPRDHVTDTRLATALAACPLVAILRGITPEEAPGIARALYAAGLRVIEVALNSPDPMHSIAAIVEALPPSVCVGGGTVRTAAAVAAIRDAGASMVIMPHVDPTLIRASKDTGMVCIPGVATPTEAFHALDAGADALKLFPAEPMGAATLQAWRAIIPPSVPILPVGGIVPDHLAPYIHAGASGFGLGSALYRPGMTPEAVQRQATRFVFAVAAARAASDTAQASAATPEGNGMQASATMDAPADVD